MRITPFLVLALFNAGCGGPAFTADNLFDRFDASGQTRPDANRPDVPDVGLADMGTEADARDGGEAEGEAVDGALADSAPADSALTDSALVEGAPVDSSFPVDAPLALCCMNASTPSLPFTSCPAQSPPCGGDVYCSPDGVGWNCWAHPAGQTDCTQFNCCSGFVGVCP
jgi:hypothetical protein